MKRKILYVIVGSGTGGASTQLVALVHGLRKRGWDASVVCMLNPGGVLLSLARDHVPLMSLGMKKGIPDPRAVLRFAAIVRREEPQIVHSHGVLANLLSRVTRLLAPMPVLVNTAHSIQEGGRARELGYRLTNFLCDVTTQVSQAGMKRYINIGVVSSDRIRYIPNGINTEVFRRAPVSRKRLRDELGLGDRFVWLSLGRYTEAKDFPNLIRAFSFVANQEPNCLLLIGGTGTKEGLQEVVNRYGLDQRIRLLGVRRDVPELMNAADGYVMSSAWEGLPMVLLEAASTGLPIVATDVGGNREVVIDGQTGFLVPPKDSLALSNAMLRLMKISDAERMRMGENAMVLVNERYSIEKVIDQWESLYIDALEQKGLTA